MLVHSDRTELIGNYNGWPKYECQYSVSTMIDLMSSKQIDSKDGCSIFELTARDREEVVVEYFFL